MENIDPDIFAELMEAKQRREGKRNGNGIEIICDKLKKNQKIPEETAKEIITLYGRVSTKYSSQERRDITMCAIIVIGCNSKGTPISIKEAGRAVGLISFVDSKRRYQTRENQKTFLLNNSQGHFQLVKRVNKRIHIQIY